MSMPALIRLRDELDEMLQRIRAGRNIRTPIITRRKCGMTGASNDAPCQRARFDTAAEPIRNRL
jgi:hypothetical protein